MRRRIEFEPTLLLARSRIDSPFGVAVALGAIALLAAVVVWATVSRVDVVSTAYGRVVPSQRSRSVQSVIDGTILRIDVREASKVESGDVVVVLDASVAREGRDKLADRLARTLLDRARLRALLSDDPGSSFVAPAEADSSDVAEYSRLLTEQALWHRSEIETIHREILKIRETIGAIDAERTRDRKLIPLSKKRVEASTQMITRGHAARLPHLELEEQLIRLEDGIAVYDRQIGEWSREIDRLVSVKEARIREFRSRASSELVALTGSIADMRRELAIAGQLVEDHAIRSPISGSVQELRPNSAGEYVSAGQVLMLVVPTESELEVEARIANRDIGFVEIGQEAEIKFEAYPFTRYGNVRGTLKSLSRDVVTSEGPPAVNVTTDVNERKALAEFVAALPGTNYLARFSMPEPWLEVSGRKVTIEPGMTATVDIRVAQRRVIDFLISPLIRYSDESFRER